jgi:hypothetical protein
MTSTHNDMIYKFSIITVVLIFLGVIGGAAATPPPPSSAVSVAEEKIETWADNHPRAASELGEWVTINTDAARELFKWDAFHPEQSKLFATWVITHQGKGLDVFTLQHTDWHRFQAIIREHHSAVSAFMVWCRFHPKATMALMQHPRALHWVGRHLYESLL